MRTQNKTVKNDKFDIKFGAMQPTNYKSYYINIRTWFTPMDNVNHNLLTKQVKQAIYNHLITTKDTHTNETITSIEWPQNGLILDKEVFVEIEIVVFKNKKQPNLSQIEKEAIDIINTVINQLSSQPIKFSKRKTCKNKLNCVSL